MASHSVPPLVQLPLQHLWMLDTPQARKQRDQFSKLLWNTRGHDNNEHGDTAAFDATHSEAAGIFGCLDPDIVCLLFGRLLSTRGHVRRSKHEIVDEVYQVPGEVSHVTTCSRIGDREAPLSHEDVLAATLHVQALAQTCRFMNACVRLHGQALLLELAAARCTRLAPSFSIPWMLQCRAPFPTPMLAQLLQEERSRFDVQMLESALASMVSHCGSEHCRAVRCAYNGRLASAAYLDELKKSPIRLAMLETHRPCVKVVHDGKNGILGTHPQRSDCVIYTNDDDRMHVAVLSDDAPLQLDPCTELRRVWRVELPKTPSLPPDTCSQTHPPPYMPMAPMPTSWTISQQPWSVLYTAISPCGQWVAIVRAQPGSRERCHMPDHNLSLWKVDAGNEPHASFTFCDGSVRDPWFRTTLVDADDAEDGIARENATILCFYGCMWAPMDHSARPDCWETISTVSTEMGGSSIHTHLVYQFCIEDGSFTNAPVHYGRLPWWLGHRLHPVGGVVRLNGDRSVDTLAHNVEDETAILSVTDRGCPDSVAVCLLGGAHVRGFRVLGVAQCAVLDLCYHNRNNGDISTMRPVTSMLSINATQHKLIPHRVYLGPRGDVAVVLMGRIGATVGVNYNLRVYGRRGSERAFQCLVHMDLNQSIHRFRTDHSLANAIAGFAPRPSWKINVARPPTSAAFSPCGRFILLGFSHGLHAVALNNPGQPGVSMHTAPPSHADGGVCVVDLSEGWKYHLATAAPACVTNSVGWIECMSGLVPHRMRWTRAGIWINTRRGTLLLGTTTA